MRHLLIVLSMMATSFFITQCGTEAKNPGGSSGNADVLSTSNTAYLHFNTPTSSTLDPTSLHGLWQVLKPEPEVMPPSDQDPNMPSITPKMDYTERWHFDLKGNKVTKSARCDFRQGTVLYAATVSSAQFENNTIRILEDSGTFTQSYNMFCKVNILATGYVGYSSDPATANLTILYPESDETLTKISDK